LETTVFFVYRLLITKKTAAEECTIKMLLNLILSYDKYLYWNNIRAKYSSSGFGTAVVAVHLNFRIDFQLLYSVTFSEICLLQFVPVIKGGNRRHFSFLFWKCFSFPSIFFQCPVFAYRPSISNSFSLVSVFFPLWLHFCHPSNSFSFFAHIVVIFCTYSHAYVFSNLYSSSLVLSVSFNSSFLPVRSTPY
jgi:hypothetical protein